MVKNLILLATYWNEIDIVEASLSQIDQIDPMEIIICDGCFDDRYPPYSTDGTREIIEKYVNERDDARLVSPKRYSRGRGTWNIYKGHDKISTISRLKPSRLHTVVTALRGEPYRINQALVFNHMISISKYWKIGHWFMTYDCDQFYSDKMIETFSIVNDKTDYGLLTAKEYTFFTDFHSYTKDYEKRTFNNMPHRILSNSMIIPTRQLVVEKIILRAYYANTVKTKYVGEYFHYKFINTERSAAGYEVGNRKAPNIKNYSFIRFEGEHPTIIQEYFKDFIG